MNHKRNLWWVLTLAILMIAVAGAFLGAILWSHNFTESKALVATATVTAILLDVMWVVARHSEESHQDRLRAIETLAIELNERLDAVADVTTAIRANLDRVVEVLATASELNRSRDQQQSPAPSPWGPRHSGS